MPYRLHFVGRVVLPGVPDVKRTPLGTARGTASNQGYGLHLAPLLPRRQDGRGLAGPKAYTKAHVEREYSCTGIGIGVAPGNMNTIYGSSGCGSTNRQRIGTCCNGIGMHRQERHRYRHGVATAWGSTAVNRLAQTAALAKQVLPSAAPVATADPGAAGCCPEAWTGAATARAEDLPDLWSVVAAWGLVGPISDEQQEGKTRMTRRV